MHLHPCQPHTFKISGVSATRMMSAICSHVVKRNPDAPNCFKTQSSCATNKAIGAFLVLESWHQLWTEPAASDSGIKSFEAKKEKGEGTNLMRHHGKCFCHQKSSSRDPQAKTETAWARVNKGDTPEKSLGANTPPQKKKWGHHKVHLMVQLTLDCIGRCDNGNAH